MLNNIKEHPRHLIVFSIDLFTQTLILNINYE
jgi:hypothetical protein